MYVLFVLSYHIMRRRYNTTKIVYRVCGNGRAWTTVSVESRNVSRGHRRHRFCIIGNDAVVIFPDSYTITERRSKKFASQHLL